MTHWFWDDLLRARVQCHKSPWHSARGPQRSLVGDSTCQGLYPNWSRCKFSSSHQSRGRNQKTLCTQYNSWQARSRSIRIRTLGRSFSPRHRQQSTYSDRGRRNRRYFECYHRGWHQGNDDGLIPEGGRHWGQRGGGEAVNSNASAGCLCFVCGLLLMMLWEELYGRMPVDVSGMVRVFSSPVRDVWKIYYTVCSNLISP